MCCTSGQNHVLPAYRNYLLPYRHFCDLHVVNESGFERAVHVLRDHLMQAAGVVEPIDLQGLVESGAAGCS